MYNCVGTIICEKKDLPAIIAGLVREGVTFEATQRGDGDFCITLTGGY
jgi:hypothetical protein